jgi:hypothetical protein
MYSLFALLFKRAYWRMLFRGGTWVDAWRSLRRAHKDKRARKHLLSFVRMLVIPIVCAAYLAWLARMGALLFLPLLAPIIWWSNRRKRNETPLHIAPTAEPVVRELTNEESRALRVYFGQLALFYSAMTDRAGSENFLKVKVLPAGLEVTSRRSHLELLRSTGLWDRMAQRDREAMMMADGHWEWALINEVATYLEPVRLLRWILRVDFHLPVVGRQLRGDFGLSHEIVGTPQKVLQAKELVTVRDMERAQGAAREFYGRCLAESLSRGYHSTENEEVQSWAKDLSASLKGKQHEDLLLGDKLVSETDKAGLLWATELARSRLRFLNWAIHFLKGGKLPVGEMSVFASETPASNAEVALS